MDGYNRDDGETLSSLSMDLSVGLFESPLVDIYKCGAGDLWGCTFYRGDVHDYS